jgi:L,D-transpeptidase YbiS
MRLIKILIPEQTLSLLEDDSVLQSYSISSGKNGVGEQMGSEQTPRGWHQIRAKIGRDCAENTVFVARRPSGEIYSRQMLDISKPRDWILTRILWLSGLELGKNRLGKVDTMRRYIYIHGSPDEVEMGVPGSRGCIRMRNKNIIELFDRVKVGDKVLIET